MPANPSPAITAFAQAIGDTANFAQLRISRSSAGFELRHRDDADQPEGSLRETQDLRALAMETADGAFRPLKTAPNLRTGWRCRLPDLVTLETALDHLYPGAITDWHLRDDATRVTPYREFTARQTGMYRLTGMLDADTAPPVFDACCDDRFCLKQRRWNYDSTVPEPAAGLLPPCLEPCPVLLEFARKAVRINQEGSAPIPLSPSELETLLAALDEPAGNDRPREANFADARNLRRRALLKPRLKAALDRLREEPEQ